MKLKDKIAIVTGGTGGIGKGITLEFLKEGATVVALYKNNDEKASKAKEEFLEISDNIEVKKVDVSDEKAFKSLIDETVKKYHRVDIMVNNAGISKQGLLIDMKMSDYEEVMNSNFKSVFIGCKYAIGDMISRKYGVILNISSMWGEVGASCESLYSASKGAINSFTKSLAKEMGPSGIRVNAISPGIIDTDMNKIFTKQEREELKDGVSLMRFGAIEEVGKAAVFLCSDDSSYITGEILKIDGGCN